MHKTRNSKVVSPKPFSLRRWKVEMGGNNNTTYSPGTCVSGLFDEHLCSECDSELWRRKKQIVKTYLKNRESGRIASVLVHGALDEAAKNKAVSFERITRNLNDVMQYVICPSLVVIAGFKYRVLGWFGPGGVEFPRKRKNVRNIKGVQFLAR
jgi:hypothetical protein